MKKTVRLLAVALTLVMLMGVVTSCDIPFIDELGNFTGLQDIFDAVTGGEEELVASTENFEVYTGEAMCFFIAGLSDFNTKYSSMINSGYGFYDVNTPFDEQYIDGSSVAAYAVEGFNGTWLDYFTNKARNDIEETLILCEYAHQVGIAAPVVDAMNFNRVGFAAVDHINAMITDEDIQEYTALKALADAARAEITEEAKNQITNADIDNFGDDGSASCIDVIEYSFYVYRIDFESDDAYYTHLDKMRAHMEEVCAASDAQEFVNIMDGKSDDVADYIKKGIRKDSLDKEVASKLFDGTIGTTAYAEIDQEANGKPAVNFVAYMRHSDVYTARTKNYYYAEFSTSESAQMLIDQLKTSPELNYDIFNAEANKYGATAVEHRVDQIKSDKLLGGVIYKYADTSTPITGGDYKVNYYAGNTSSSVKDYAYSGSYSDAFTKIEYETTNFNNQNGDFSYTIIGGGSQVIKPITPGNSFITIGGVLGTVAGVDNWVFNESRVAGDITDTPIMLGANGYAVVVYEGEGDYIWRIEAKNTLAAQKAEDRISKLNSSFGVDFNADLRSLAEAPKSSGLDFLPF